VSNIDTIDVQFMMVCDAAQAIGGKLYILGGAWERIVVPELPGRPPLPFFLAIGITVPWALANQRFVFCIDLLTEDGERLEELVQAELEAGRPPGMRPGSVTRIPMVGPAQPEFPTAGRYVFQAVINGEPARHIGIDVVLSAPPVPA